MKRATKFAGAITVLAGVSIVAASLYRHEDPTKPVEPKRTKSAQEVALDTLETQLQRRFHDRNNLTFGFERVVRKGAREHASATADLTNLMMMGEDGKPYKTRVVDNKYQVDIGKGDWIPSNEFKQTMRPENDDEKGAISNLKDTQVAIYTAGFFDAKTGEASRLKGPAYLRQKVDVAPSSKSISDAAAKAWATKNDVDEIRQNGWIYRVVKVKADDKSCINCHGEQKDYYRTQVGKPLTLRAAKLGDPIGVFLIGYKPKS